MDHSIVVVGYQTHELTGIANEAIVDQVLHARDNKLTADRRHTEYEDSELPHTPEAEALVSAVDARIRAVDPRLQQAGIWAHVLSPGESTMYHTHSMSNFPGIGLSWVYYASYPPDSGELVFVCEVNDKRVYHRVEPMVGRLVMFSAGLPHMTTKHVGQGVRVSISGNYYLPPNVQQAIQNGQDTTRVSYFTG